MMHVVHLYVVVIDISSLPSLPEPYLSMIIMIAIHVITGFQRVSIFHYGHYILLIILSLFYTLPTVSIPLRRGKN